MSRVESPLGLRVGLVLSGGRSQAWVAALLSSMRATSFASVVAVVQASPATPRTPYGFLSRRWWSRRLFDCYERWDRKRNGMTKDALAPADLGGLLATVPVFVLSQDVDNGRDWEALRALDLDLLLCLHPVAGLVVPDGVTRYGLWRLEIDGTPQYPEQPPVWRAHASQAAAVVTRLVCYGNGADVGSTPKLLYETQTALNPFSLAQSRNPVYWKAVEIVLRCLRSVAADGRAYMEALPDALVAAASPGNPQSSSRGMTRFLRGELERRLRARSGSARRASFAKWCIGLRARVAGTSFDNPAEYRLIVAPRDRFYADPFLFEHEGRTWLFFEDFRYPENKAVISCCELNERGEPDEAFEVLRLPYHLSYPFVFEEGGSIYMLPESRGNRTVSLFRATEFPRTWEQDSDLFSGTDIVDATLHHAEDGTWWMFAGVSNGSYSNSDELCLFFADSFRGPWTPHPQNPVVSDVRRARPAGRIFREGGKLLRPSQDCGPAYGYGLVFSEIEELTRTCYRESILGRLLPESVPGNTANHTYNRTVKFETIDRFFIESRLPQTDTFPAPFLTL